MQFFRCVPGSSYDDTPTQVGFIGSDSPPANRVADIKVEPGHFIFFRQPILHCVLKTKVKMDSYRQFVAFRITHGNATQPMFPIGGVISNQSVPPLPSGQIPPMFSLNHNSALLYSTTIPWSDRRVRDELKEDRVLRGCVVRMCPRIISKGLVDFGWAYPKYGEDERRIMVPHKPIEWTSLIW